MEVIKLESKHDKKAENTKKSLLDTVDKLKQKVDKGELKGFAAVGITHEGELRWWQNWPESNMLEAFAAISLLREAYVRQEIYDEE